jgi:hypothetical protein
LSVRSILFVDCSPNNFCLTKNRDELLAVDPDPQLYRRIRSADPRLVLCLNLLLAGVHIRRQASAVVWSSFRELRVGGGPLHVFVRRLAKETKDTKHPLASRLWRQEDVSVWVPRQNPGEEDVDVDFASVVWHYFIKGAWNDGNRMAQDLQHRKPWADESMRIYKLRTYPCIQYFVRVLQRRTVTLIDALLGYWDAPLRTLDTTLIGPNNSIKEIVGDPSNFVGAIVKEVDSRVPVRRLRQ